MTLLEMLPKQTDRAVFVGQTGSGKTTLARRLLAFRRFVVVHDGKGRLNWQGYTLARSLNDVLRYGKEPLRYPKIVYRPSSDELIDVETQERFFRWVYARGNTTLYVDEVYSIIESSRINAGFLACMTRGREPSVEVWCATQRPTWIPLPVLSESEHAFSFRLQMPDDRRRMQEVFGVEEDLIQDLRKHEYIYASLERGIFGPLKLQLAS